MSNHVQQDVDVEVVIDQLIGVNKSATDRFIDLFGTIETDITDPQVVDDIMSELAEFMESIVLVGTDSTGQVMGVMEQLQTAIINSYFPPQ